MSHALLTIAFALYLFDPASVPTAADISPEQRHEIHRCMKVYACDSVGIDEMNRIIIVDLKRTRAVAQLTQIEAMDWIAEIVSMQLGEPLKSAPNDVPVDMKFVQDCLHEGTCELRIDSTTGMATVSSLATGRMIGELRIEGVIELASENDAEIDSLRHLVPTAHPIF